MTGDRLQLFSQIFLRCFYYLQKMRDSLSTVSSNFFISFINLTFRCFCIFNIKYRFLTVHFVLLKKEIKTYVFNYYCLTLPYRMDALGEDCITIDWKMRKTTTTTTKMKIQTTTKTAMKTTLFIQRAERTLRGLPPVAHRNQRSPRCSTLVRPSAKGRPLQECP